MQLLLISIITILLSIPSQSLDTAIMQKGDNPQLKVYYFHGERRCFTCNSIEKHTKTTLDTYFAKEIEKGLITYEVINIDKAENKAIARKFNVISSSLFIEKKIAVGYEKLNLTNFAFSNGKNETKYIAEFKKKLDELLK
ncbi:MAG: thioredoxin [Bacteroidetes bacterium]|jgi:hypothetical protein|nr:thioredoxin [Bacteroidota bacterium]MBT5529259.1 thioredoxin [Cytophagia bacterium]MBT3802306.1 thioredoxin [Bacteroidota bacterium]MBT3933107.1 thioredoxin [Bacteroidota bacterium]MBT4339511.1 thioredoxin [Bacteroidota bacterium]